MLKIYLNELASRGQLGNALWEAATVVFGLDNPDQCETEIEIVQVFQSLPERVNRKRVEPKQMKQPGNVVCSRWVVIHD
jgi:hypothetical protein